MNFTRENIRLEKSGTSKKKEAKKDGYDYEREILFSSPLCIYEKRNCEI